MKTLNLFAMACFLGISTCFVPNAYAQAKRAPTTTPTRPAATPAPRPAATRPTPQPTRATPTQPARTASSVPRGNNAPARTTSRPTTTSSNTRSTTANTNSSSPNTRTNTRRTTPVATAPPVTTPAVVTTPTPSSRTNNRTISLIAKENCFVKVNGGEEIALLKEVPTPVSVSPTANTVTIRTVAPDLTWTQEINNVARGTRKEIELNFAIWYQAKLRELEQNRVSEASETRLKQKETPSPSTLRLVSQQPVAAKPAPVLPESPTLGQMWTNSVSVPFLWIPAGTFPMGKSGDAEDSPVHEVTFSKGFWIGKYEVTQAQWVAIMETNPSGFKGENRPVENVSFEEVQEFIRRLNEKEGWNKYSLPTEAQWEYTARANTNTKYSWGDRMEKNRANCTNCGSTWDNKETAPIGSFAANPWGMSDMNGNVMEWVNDWYGDRYYTTPEANQDPKGPAQGENRVIRGGGFDINAEDLQSHVRGFVAPNFKRNDLGFRLVVNMQP